MPDTALPRSPALLDAAGAAALIASYATVTKGAALKDIGRIDVHMGRFIALSPLCLVATADAQGKQDVTPRGDPPGAFKVLDEHTLALADRPGNNRLDTLKNILENPEIALIFLLPGIAETVRVAGTARLSVDAELLASMAVQGKEPKCAIVISVRQAYLHCAKAINRAGLWDAARHIDRNDLPSYGAMLVDHCEGLTAEESERQGAEMARRGMY